MNNATRWMMVALVGLSALLAGCNESSLASAGTSTGFAVAGVAGAQYAAPLLPGGFVAAKPAKRAAAPTQVARVRLAERNTDVPLMLPPVPVADANGGFPPGTVGAARY